MANSSAVAANDPATAEQYNDLRDDVLDIATGHVHSGAADGGAALPVSSIPALPASKITSERFGVSRLPAVSSGNVLVGTGGDMTETALPAAITSGIIVMWSGTLASIPAGYVLCDGNNSTPNLLNRFIQCVTDGATDPGSTGGAILKTTNGHYHANPNTSTVGGHTHSLVIVEDGDHSHTTNKAISSQDTSGNNTHVGTDPTAGAHDHSGSGAQSGGGHSHALSNTEGATDTITDIRPPYYQLAFIMKT